MQHDDAAHTIDLVYPDGRRERTELDGGGRPARVRLIAAGGLGGTPGSVMLELGYTGWLRPALFSSGNDAETRFIYDDAARLIRTDVVRAGQELESVRVQYDRRHRRAVTQHLGAPVRSTWHGFDNRDRLRQARWDFPLRRSGTCRLRPRNGPPSMLRHWRRRARRTANHTRWTTPTAPPPCSQRANRPSPIPWGPVTARPASAALRLPTHRMATAQPMPALHSNTTRSVA
jgi:hypothetical protein